MKNLQDLIIVVALPFSFILFVMGARAVGISTIRGVALGGLISVSLLILIVNKARPAAIAVVAACYLAGVMLGLMEVFGWLRMV